MDITEQKKALRKRMLMQRQELDMATKQAYDEAICTRLEEMILEGGHRVVHAYIPMAGEIDISPLLSRLLQKGVTVVCPKTLRQRQLENRVLRSFHELETGIMGTQHPLHPELHEGSYDLIIVPGLACDRNNYRLGYGGGYYDNFLAAQPQALKIGIFYPFQQIETVPTEPHDIRLDKVLLGEW